MKFLSEPICIVLMADSWEDFSDENLEGFKEHLKVHESKVDRTTEQDEHELVVGVVSHLFDIQAFKVQGTLLKQSRF